MSLGTLWGLATRKADRFRRDWGVSLVWQSGLLFSIDSATNLIDYGFHIYLGRALSAPDFAIVQTINAVVLALMTVAGVMQPVVARYVAEATMTQAGHVLKPLTKALGEQSRIVFQFYFRYCTLLGIVLSAVAWLGRRIWAGWLGVPPLAVGLSSVLFLLSLLRPVVGGVLQGQERFVALGLTRLAYAVGRFLTGAILIALGGGALGAIAAMPIGSALALAGGLGLLGASAWQRVAQTPGKRFLLDGMQLSAGAFLAYAAYMSLLSSDLIWVNRSFSLELAGGYAAAVLLRRILVLLPGAVTAVMYPRVVAQITRGELPDKLLGQTTSIVAGAGFSITLLYFIFGSHILRLTLGHAYLSAAPLLGWMGLAMLGYSLGAIWINLYLAVRPFPFVFLLALLALSQNALFAYRHDTLLHVVGIFALSGWALALSGFPLYWFWLRPKLLSASMDSRFQASS